MAEALIIGRLPSSLPMDESENEYLPAPLPSWLLNIPSILSRLVAVSAPAGILRRTSRPSSVLPRSATEYSCPECSEVSSTSTPMLRFGALASTSFSKAVSMFLNSRAPLWSWPTFRHRIVLPRQTSPLKPTISLLPRGMKEKPSPLARVMLRSFSRTATVTSPEASLPPFAGVIDTTVPTSSPIGLGASMEDQEPLFPSRNSSVYPRLKVFSGSGTKPPVTLPKDALR